MRPSILASMAEPSGPVIDETKHQAVYFLRIGELIKTFVVDEVASIYRDIDPLDKNNEQHHGHRG